MNFENDQKSIAPLRALSQAVSNFETSSAISKRVLLAYDPRSIATKRTSARAECWPVVRRALVSATVVRSTGPAARLTQLLGYLT